MSCAVEIVNQIEKMKEKSLTRTTTMMYLSRDILKLNPQIPLEVI